MQGWRDSEKQVMHIPAFKIISTLQNTCLKALVLVIETLMDGFMKLPEVALQGRVLVLSPHISKGCVRKSLSYISIHSTHREAKTAYLPPHTHTGRWRVRTLFHTQGGKDYIFYSTQGGKEYMLITIAATTRLPCDTAVHWPPAELFISKLAT